MVPTHRNLPRVVRGSRPSSAVSWLMVVTWQGCVGQQRTAAHVRRVGVARSQQDLTPGMCMCVLSTGCGSNPTQLWACLAAPLVDNSTQIAADGRVTRGLDALDWTDLAARAGLDVLQHRALSSSRARTAANVDALPAVVAPGRPAPCQHDVGPEAVHWQLSLARRRQVCIQVSQVLLQSTCANVTEFVRGENSGTKS